MRNDTFMRTYSPRQEALAREAAHKQAAATRPASTAAAGDILAPYRVQDEPYYRPVGNEVAVFEAARQRGS